jgi:hypothetical protein
MAKRRPIRFTKRDFKRAVESFLETGQQIASIEIKTDGTILIVPGKPPVPSANPWDAVLRHDPS